MHLPAGVPGRHKKGGRCGSAGQLPGPPLKLAVIKALSSSSIACTRLINWLASRLVREVAGPSGAHMTRERRRLSSSHDSSYIDPTVPNTCSLLLRARCRLLTLRQLSGVIVSPAMAPHHRRCPRR